MINYSFLLLSLHISAVIAFRISSKCSLSLKFQLYAERKGFLGSLKEKIGGLFSRPLQVEKKPTPTVNIINKKIVIIGAGVSGLVCAKELVRRGETDFVILEASDGVGGRIRTDIVDGYLLDRGFQVFIDQYPESQKVFNYKDLDLAYFNPGAVVRYDKQFHIVSDPFRRPQDLLASLVSPIGSFPDKVRVGIFSILIRFKSLEKIFSSDEVTTYKKLTYEGLSDSMIDRFFTPFFQGIFLSSLSAQSSRMFEFVFKMFAEGSATLPAAGMGELMNQLAAALPADSIQLNTKVTSINASIISTPSAVYKSEYTVVATEAPVAQKLLSGSIQYTEVIAPVARKSTCLYFSIDGPPPITEPVLVLNGENKLAQAAFDVEDVLTPDSIHINNVCFPSQVSSKYAPAGKSLASITVVGNVETISDVDLLVSVRRELMEWWGEETQRWKLLRIYRVPYAQPAQVVPYNIRGSDPRVGNRLYCCGDHRGTATLNGAIASGLRTAACIAEDAKL